MELIPGRERVDAETRQQWVRAGARTRLAAVRLRRGVRQEDLAAVIGISTASLRRIESGQSGSGVDVGILLTAAMILQVPVTTLIEDEWLEAAEKATPARRSLPVPVHQVIPEPGP
jgi:transcriptional regulator with XRE-family HTH domain